MKKGDIVISTGDRWISAGSVGIVKAYKNSNSVLVGWNTIVGSIHKIGTSLYHKERDLTIAKDGPMNPDTAFMLRK